jgi:hypothetical protein
MSIDPSIRFSVADDDIIGLDETKTAMANQLLVFMLCGTYKNWRQPIGYFLISRSVEVPALKSMILEGICKAHEAGVRVSAFCSRK